MGSAESFGALHIDVDSPNYRAGDTITGKIYMLVKQAVSASTILLFLKCTERTEYPQRIDRGKRSRVVTRKGKNRILRQRFEVFQIPGGTLQPGQFSFPFSIQSPADLKNSFSYEEPWIPILNDGRVLGVIGYKLVAKVDRADAHIDKGECPISITSPVAEVMTSSSQETIANIRNWCCFAKGTVKVRANFDKVVYLPGETAVITMEVDNEQSQLPVATYCVTLRRTITMTSNQGNMNIITTTVNSTELDVMLPAGRNASDSAKQLELIIPSDQNVEKATSTRGSLITCEYRLKAEAVMAGWFTCCGQPTSVEIVVTIHPPDLEKIEAPKVEGEWQPKTMPKRQFSAGPEHEYETKQGNTEVNLGE